MADKKQNSGEQMMTMTQVQDLIRQREQLKTVNEIKVACMVMEIIEMESKPKVNKKTGEAVLDDDGKPTFWDVAYWVVCATMGSEEGFMLSSIQVQNLEVGQTYLFTGHLKNRKVKVDTITLI